MSPLTLISIGSLSGMERLKELSAPKRIPSIDRCVRGPMGSKSSFVTLNPAVGASTLALVPPITIELNDKIRPAGFVEPSAVHSRVPIAL